MESAPLNSRRVVWRQWLMLICFAGAGHVGASFAQEKGRQSDRLTDMLLAHAIYANAPDVLFERADNEWPGGRYSLSILKDGRPEVLSSMDQVDTLIPVQVDISGEVASELLQVKARCHSSFQTLVQVQLVRRLVQGEREIQSDVTFPVPPVKADCGGLSIPIDSILSALVATQELQWEKKIDTEINAWARSWKSP